jgi:hypothetical protein
MDAEEQRLRNFPGDFMTPADPFTSGVGLFYGIHETRTYMRNCFALVEKLQAVNTNASVNAQLEHLQDMLRLSRGDNMGVRYLVPALLLRLGRDQECYDFIKWYRTEGQRGDYDWGDTTLGFLDVKDADVFEDVELYCSEYGDLSFTACITLLKIRLLLDLQNLSKAVDIQEPRAADEASGTIQQKLVRSPIILKNRELLESKDHSGLLKKLEGQIKALYEATNRINKFYWIALLQPGNNLTAKPMMYIPGTEEEMQLKLQYTYNAWKETPGSIDFIKRIRQEL